MALTIAEKLQRQREKQKQSMERRMRMYYPCVIITIIFRALININTINRAKSLVDGVKMTKTPHLKKRT